MADVASKILRGTFGRLWLNGELMAQTKSFEAKVTMNYETVQVSGELADQQRFIGYSIAGTMTMHKVNSRLTDIVRAQLTTGVSASLSLVATLDDPDASGAERVELYNVTLDETTLIAFENAKLGEESVGFKAGGFRVLQSII